MTRVGCTCLKYDHDILDPCHDLRPPRQCKALGLHCRLLITALVKSLVVASPPKSLVRYLPSAMTLRMACWMLSASLVKPLWRSIMMPDMARAVGLARSFPAMSGAVPCTASAKHRPFSPMLAEGVKPKPPMRPALKSLMISPYKLGITITSNCPGSRTSCMQQLSTMTSSYWISGYFSRTSRQHSKNNPSAFFMMLALCTAVILFLLFSLAYLKANSATRVLALRVMTFKLSTTPGTTSCSRPLYSPSVFSRTVTKSTLSYRVL
mmetsp:Transcript_5576/g.15015  ORF Transcript_5576/g.15015 Transcript_5576/m.15015 type:complete len:265 (+) Transcript_5576:483-1277(+)